jgi:hypothetical protein
MPSPTPVALAHALPESVGAVPLTVILTGVIALLLAAGSVGTRRAAALVGVPRPVPEGDGDAPPARRPGPTPGQLLGLTGLVLLGALATTGPADAASNLSDVAVLVLLWGAVALSSAVVGGWWPLVDPLRGAGGLLAIAVGDPDHAQARPMPDGLATAAAAVGLLAWAWVQLLVTASTLTFQLLLIGYVALHLAAAARYGPAWLDRAEPLTVVSRTLGLLRPGGGGPLLRLTGTADGPWLRAVCGILIGWSLADLVLETEAWHELGLSSSGARLAGTALLLAAALGTWGLIAAAAGRSGGGPAFVAVAAGWVAAHYLSLLLIEGQGVPIWLSDPFATGADLFGRADAMVDLEPVPTDVLAAIQAVPFVLGHLAGIVVVQRRAAARVRSAAQLGPATFLPRALIAVLLVGGTYLQLGGL